MRLFNQSRRVCHTKPQMVARSTVPNCPEFAWAGHGDAEVISNGTPRMPGFKNPLELAQIYAIVVYLKTIPTPPPPAPAVPVR